MTVRQIDEFLRTPGADRFALLGKIVVDGGVARPDAPTRGDLRAFIETLQKKLIRRAAPA